MPDSIAAADVVFSMAQWVSVVEVPIVGFLVRTILTVREDARRQVETVNDALHANEMETTRQITEARREGSDALASYKLEAAERFASVAHLREVEDRLVRCLEKIEGKLDKALGRE